MRWAAVMALVAGCTSTNPDYIPPATGCAPGERACVTARPVECVPGDGGTYLRRAVCPTAGGCVGGRCSPPAGAKACARESDCLATETCTAFVDGSALKTYCTLPEGAVPGGVMCTDPAQCRSDLCVTTASGAVKQVCYQACQGDTDCTAPYGCRSFVVTISGVQGTISGCGPK
jgi:hypothetical protein